MALYWGGFSQHTKEIEYSTIKDVRIEQNSFDKLFGLASVQIVGDQKASWAISYVKNVRYFQLTNMMGIARNVAYISGLNVKDANTLKEVLLEKTKG